MTENENNIGNVNFTYEDIRDAIYELSPTAAAGLDAIPAILLNKCKKEISIPLEKKAQMLKQCTLTFQKPLIKSIKEYFARI